MNCILGIEGGGTKTTWAICNREGAVLRSGKQAASNCFHASDSHLRSVLQNIREATGPVDAVGGAFAGCQLEKVRKRLLRLVRATWPEARRFAIEEDTHSAFAGAHGKGAGIIVIAGTGANVMAHRNGQWEKAGGWEYLFSDGGSGYDIARRGLESVFQYYDHTQQVSPLGKLLLKHSGAKSLEHLVPWVMRHSSKTSVANLAPYVFEAALIGDGAAKQVIRIGATRLAENVKNVKSRLKLRKPPVGLVGSLFEKQPTYVRLFQREVEKRTSVERIFINQTPGAVGAAFLTR